MTTTSGDRAVALTDDVPDAPKRSILRDVRPELRSVAHYREQEVSPEYADAAARTRGPRRAAV